MKIRPKIAILFFARAFGIFAISRYITKSRLRILCYHGGVIGDENQYNPKLFCSADILRKRMVEMKRQGFKFLSLDEAVAQQTNSAPKAPLRAVVTFDDGWYSTVNELVPVLSEMKIPSTLYLSTKNFLEGWPILSVTVRYVIWKAGKHSITVRGWGRDIDGVYALQHAQERHRLAGGIVKAIEDSTNGRDQVFAALEKFTTCLGLPVSVLRLDSRRFDYVTKQELIDSVAHGCTIELHGHVHDYPKGNPRQLIEDLNKCEETIVGLGLAKPRHYCYPSGSFDSQASETLDGLNILSATTCIPGLVTKIDQKNRHYLPRFLDGENIHSLEFEAEMSGFSDVIRSGIRILRNSPLRTTIANARKR